MKKVFVLLLSCLCLMFCGCSKENREPVQEFTAIAEVKSQRFMPEDFLLTAEVERTAEGDVYICVVSPKGLEGLTYSWQDNFEMEYNGLVCKSESDYLPSFSYARIIYDVLCDLYEKGECVSSDSGISTYMGSIATGEYSVSVDHKGYINNISVEKINFSADLSYN